MKAVKIKREHYGVIKEMTDRQAGEFVKSSAPVSMRGSRFLQRTHI